MFTTEGNTAFTTGAKLALLGPRFGSASFKVAGGLAVNNFWLARAAPMPATPRARPRISASLVFHQSPVFCMKISPFTSQADGPDRAAGLQDMTRRRALRGL